MGPRSKRRDLLAGTRPVGPEQESLVPSVDGGDVAISVALAQQQRRIDGLERTLSQLLEHPRAQSDNIEEISLLTPRGPANGAVNGSEGSRHLCRQETHHALDDAFTQLEQTTGDTSFLCAEDDDDLLISAFVHGWTAVKRKYRLDRVWRFLLMLDKHVFTSMEKVSRLAAIRALRAKLIHVIRPAHQPERRIPTWFEPTLLQQTRTHPHIIDYFAWPAVRDHMISNNCDIPGLPRTAMHSFSKNFILEWPYAFRDTYRVCATTARYTFSQDFDARYHDLNFWTVAVHEDTSVIPAYMQGDWKLLTMYIPTFPLRWVEPPVHEGFTGKSSNSASPRTDRDVEGDCDLLVDTTGVRVVVDETEDNNVGTDHQTAALCDWSWTLDDARPEHSIFQDLLDYSIPA
jgi:hypothetical protein